MCKRYGSGFRGNLERLRSRAQAAVQEEVQRQQAPMSPFDGAASSTWPTSTSTRNSSMRARKSSTPTRPSAMPTATCGTPTSTRRPSGEGTPMPREVDVRASCTVRTVTRGTQTNEGTMIGTERLQGFEGPYYVTNYGDRVHLSARCHGLRNATQPPRAFRVCQYCDRDRPLFQIAPG